MAKAKRRSQIDSSSNRVKPCTVKVEAGAVKDEDENDLEMLDEVGKCPEGGCYVECGFLHRLRERRPKSA
ncbi:MAG: hypothetical protein SFV17_23185 [Candidatus Obscuribacter sp.]|nr:hypothetical protein [Candidatus Melainabacteria bacterium]MDX1989613.1 hypothetical protein [Candidatus Obscuribacter sp.]